jgi:uncharacterized protein YndB with AHSA1/START domain
LDWKGGDSVTKLSKSIEIEASPEEVFNFIIDTEKMNKAHGGFTKGEYTSKGPVGLGTIMHMVGKHGGSNMEWDMEVTEFVKNKKFTTHTDKPSKMTNSLILEPTDMGTKLTHEVEYELPYSILGKIIDKLKVSRDVKKELEMWLPNTKKALEE